MSPSAILSNASGDSKIPIVEGPKLRYRLLTGPDDHVFCERVSEALEDGYVLAGSPAITFDGTTPIVAQAVVLP